MLSRPSISIPRLDAEVWRAAGRRVLFRCVICRVEFEDGEKLKLLPCKHQYHGECIEQWLNINKVLSTIHVKHGAHVPCLRAHERAKTHWTRWISTTFLELPTAVFHV